MVGEFTKTCLVISKWEDTFSLSGVVKASLPLVRGVIFCKRADCETLSRLRFSSLPYVKGYRLASSRL